MTHPHQPPSPSVPGEPLPPRQEHVRGGVSKESAVFTVLLARRPGDDA